LGVPGTVDVFLRHGACETDDRLRRGRVLGASALVAAWAVAAHVVKYVGTPRDGWVWRFAEVRLVD